MANTHPGFHIPIGTDHGCPFKFLLKGQGELVITHGQIVLLRRGPSFYRLLNFLIAQITQDLQPLLRLSVRSYRVFVVRKVRPFLVSVGGDAPLDAPVVV